MNEKSDSFNLLEAQWIPVLYANGKTDRVGIWKALTDAGRIRQIAASNPMDRLAILRFLLALLYWCRGNLPEHESINLGAHFPEHWFSKLDTNRDCFNLLGDQKRFYQCAPCSSARLPEKLSSNYLVHEIPTGTNKWHFRHSTDEVDGLCPACCAMGLVRLPPFATSGGRGKPPGINAKPPFYLIPVGNSLAATLRLSWRPVTNLGTPAWEEPLLQLPGTGEVPLLTGLTWLPRRVWLDKPEESATRCISCGRQDRVIRRCVFAGIGSTRTDEDGIGRTWHDPHVAYGITGRGDLTLLHARDALGSSDAAASQWTEILTGLLRDPRTFDNRASTWVVGFATVKNDKYLEAMECVIPSTPTPPQPDGCLETIQRWRQEGTGLAGRLKSASEESPRKHVEIQPILGSIRPHVEAIVSAKTGELLADGEDAWESAAREYRPMMAMVAKSLSPGFTTTALQRQNQIEELAPNMRTQPEPVKKTRRKKGDGK